MRWLQSPDALHQIRQEQAKRDFTRWLCQVTPQFTWTWRHLELTRKYLDKITSSEIDRLMIFEPPRHGKSEMVTIRYPVWRLERDPSMRVVIGSYGQELASEFSRRARSIARDRHVELSEERAAANDWQTKAGGGLRSVGVGTGITGRGADLLVIDDPVKSREEANSEAYRAKVWGWYSTDLYTRLSPGAAIILIMTRWHEDDLAGRILASEEADQWTVLSLPAFAEDDDLMGRASGEALCPERYDKEALQRIQVTLGRSFYALYQQRPQPPEGAMLQRQWFTIHKAEPHRNFWTQLVRYWDKAGTADGGAYTAGVLMGKHTDGPFWVIDVVRGQWAAAEREKVITQTAHLDYAKYGLMVEIWIEQEPGSGGKESAEATIQRLAGFKVYADRPTGDKVLRAEPFAAQAEAANINLVQGPWVPSYLGELTSFPQGTYSDQVDGSSGGLNKMTVSRRIRVY